MNIAVKQNPLVIEGSGLDNELLLKSIDNTVLDGSLDSWKKVQVDDTPVIRTERAVLAAESWKASRGEDIQIRRARLLANILENLTPQIQPWQLLAGSESQDIFGVHPDVDLCTTITTDAMTSEFLPIGSPEVAGIISEEERQILLQCVEVFRGDSVFEHVESAWLATFGTNPMNWVSTLHYMGKPGPYVRGPIQFEKIIKQGLRALIDEASAKIEEFKASSEADIDKLYFWESVIIVNEALITYAHRHADHAEALALTCDDEQRREDLLAMAEVCRHVPEHPARSMQEGMQTAMFMLLAVKLETPHLPGDSGRMDQYLWDLYKADINEGRLDQQRAVNLFDSYLAFRGGVTSLNDPNFIDMQQTVTQLNLITLGGVDRSGNGADNALTYLFLHAAGLLALPEPHLTLRWHRQTPRNIMRKGHETSVLVGGNPQFVNDEPVLEYWAARGVPQENINDQSGIGCLPPLASNVGYIQLGVVSQAKNLELILHNGHDQLFDAPIGLQTGDPREFETFEQLLEAHKKQHEFWIARLTRMHRISYSIENKFVRTPFFSSVHEDCMELGRDLAFRDLPHFYHFMNDRGCIDAADSLIAIKRLVFEQKLLTMDELITALDSDFEGKRGEEIRQLCLAQDKYGNDIDEVDTLAGALGAFGGAAIRSHCMPDGKPIETDRPGVSWHYFGGAVTAALPNGRKAREPLNDATLSPMRGQDKDGPTTVFRSAIKAGFRESLYNVLNQRISPSAVKSAETMDKLVGLTQAYMENGGMHVQYNIVDTATMRKAQEVPEENKDLVVRIGGFSAYFVQLTREMQDDVIMRNEQDV
ncbi:MAG: hypothetical protein HOC23_15430 [Halieaceae bacterium]|jgi:pyruvate-formate lyase|nr:hypothetical protein [Halieaceae bacterium]